LVVSVDVWRKLGSQVDDVNRPVFPAIGAPGLIGQNTLGAGSAASWSGMNPLGLEIVVDGNAAAGTMLVVHAPAVEFYEAQQGMRSVEVPDLLAAHSPTMATLQHSFRMPKTQQRLQEASSFKQSLSLSRKAALPPWLLTPSPINN
jgi:hypothetical protein